MWGLANDKPISRSLVAHYDNTVPFAKNKQKTRYTSGLSYEVYMEPVFRLTNAEAKLAELLWNNTPIASMEMIKLAEREFGWKKSTTFTNLKFLIGKGLAKNEKSSVTMLYTREEIIAKQSCRYVDDTFGGSLPMFIASYTSSRKLSAEQVAQLKSLLDEHGEGGGSG